jgi:tRNA/rRNA methyltransferase
MKPVIVLVEPQMGENIGACARAMLNCGVDELRLVKPRDGWPSEQAAIMSSGALDKMPEVQVFESTAAALTDCHWTYATTARPRDMIKPVMTAFEAAQDVHARSGKGQKCAYLFGPERAGLSNEDVALSHTIITIPVNPAFSSLNLAQGVLLCAYEWFQAEPRPAALPSEALAPHEELNNLYNRLEEELRAGGFFRTQESQPTAMRNIKNILGRAEMTSPEVNTFHGIITALIGKKQK